MNKNKGNIVAQLTLIIGGCRSGKSRYALELADASGLEEKKFVATCQAHDLEMEKRIARHKQERGAEWTTVEEPLEVPRVLGEESHPSSLIVLDCLTLWVSNLLQQEREEDWIKEQGVKLEQALDAASGRVLVVSNEVGQGIVPDNPMARTFRDEVGWLNQLVAAKANKVVWMVAGLPVTVKG
jgi:adenosylcobinamide kinase/adenosylcobinamide-phosphate guanylyltransferase